MVSGDIVAIGIIVLCLVIGLTTLKLLSRVLMGIFLGLIVLSCIGFLSDNTKFNELTHGIFETGVVIPYVKQKTTSAIQRRKGQAEQYQSRFLLESRR